MADTTVTAVVRAALQAEGQQLLISTASDLRAMSADWLHAIDNEYDVLDEAFGCAAQIMGVTPSELRARWASRTDEERRRWIERCSLSDDAALRAVLRALSRALDDVPQDDPATELDGLLAWLPNRERLVFGLEVSGPAAVRSLFAFATRQPQQPVIALIAPRLWSDVREQLDDRTRAQLDAGRIPIPMSPTAAATKPRADEAGASSPTCDEAASPRMLPPSELAAERARSAAESRLYELLQNEPVTHNLFELNVRMPFTFGPAQAEVDFVCRDLRLVLEVDGFFHFQRPDAYRRDRRKDVLLQHQGYLVSRHLAEDVHERGGEVMRLIRELVQRRRRSFRRESVK